MNGLGKNGSAGEVLNFAVALQLVVDQVQKGVPHSVDKQPLIYCSQSSLICAGNWKNVSDV